ncbi:MAG TPA: hypothetical protein VFW23_17785 [Tepidisphaeraceae bacterium]|nr:hypothetical protein [Tepidisphaeraceae bacterium]
MLGLLGGSAPEANRIDATQSSARFTALDVLVDSGKTPLAAYQVKIVATSGDVTLVGVEGSDQPAFSMAPYYEKHAILNKQFIVAAYSLAGSLPTGKTCVATLMVRIGSSTKPDWHITLQVAGGADGKKIPATASIVEHSGGIRS